MDNILNTILKDTYTLSQFKKRVKFLQGFLQQQFFLGPKVEMVGPEADWFKKLPKDFLNSFTKDNLSKTLTDLNTKVSSMQIMTLFLGFEATDEALNQIGQKVRSLFGGSFLVDIKYNPALIAGCALSYKGIYRDYSLHKRITERKLAIMQSFKKFLR